MLPVAMGTTRRPFSSLVVVELLLRLPWICIRGRPFCCSGEFDTNANYVCGLVLRERTLYHAC